VVLCLFACGGLLITATTAAFFDNGHVIVLIRINDHDVSDSKRW